MSFKSKNLLLLEQNTEEIEEDIIIVKLNISNLHKAFIPRLKSTETLKNRSLICYLIKTVLCTTRLFPKLDVYKSFYPAYCYAQWNAGNFNMLSNKGFLASKKERSVTAHSWWWSVRIGEVGFLWESVDWGRNKCLLSVLTGVRIKRVKFWENIRTFPRDKDNSR